MEECLVILFFGLTFAQPEPDFTGSPHKEVNSLIFLSHKKYLPSVAYGEYKLWVRTTRRSRYQHDSCCNVSGGVTMFTSGITPSAKLFPTDVQIAPGLLDGLNYVQSNGPRIQCYRIARKASSGNPSDIKREDIVRWKV